MTIRILTVLFLLGLLNGCSSGQLPDGPSPLEVRSVRLKTLYPGVPKTQFKGITFSFKPVAKTTVLNDPRRLKLDVNATIEKNIPLANEEERKELRTILVSLNRGVLDVQNKPGGKGVRSLKLIGQQITFEEFASYAPSYKKYSLEMSPTLNILNFEEEHYLAALFLKSKKNFHRETIKTYLEVFGEPHYRRISENQVGTHETFLWGIDQDAVIETQTLYSPYIPGMMSFPDQYIMLSVHDYLNGDVRITLELINNYQKRMNFID